MQRQMSAAAVASSERLLYTTTGSCLERAARSQRWRPKNKTCVSALSLVILGYSCLGIVFLLVNTPPSLRQAWSSVFTLAQRKPTLLFPLLHIKTESKQWAAGWTSSLHKTRLHPILLLFLHCSPQPPLYHSVALNGPPS